MRILHVVPTYIPAWRHGGPIFSVHALNRWLVKLGHEVTVYTTDINGLERLEVADGEERLLDGVRVRYFRSSFPRGWSYAKTMRRVLAETVRDFDIVHITSVFLAASTLGAHYAKKYKKPYIISPRGNLMKEPLVLKSAWLKKIYIALIERHNLASAGAIHFTSSLEEREYREISFPVQHAVVIPNSVDFETTLTHNISRGSFRAKYHIQNNAPLVLSLGRLSWKKGFDTLIPAFQVVKEKFQNAALVIVGEDEGGYKRTIDQLIAENHLEDSVVFTGMLRGSEKSEAYRDADVFVLPSYSENFGMTVPEAMYMNCPVVISKGVGIAEDIDHANAGAVVEKDVQAFANAIIKTLQNKEGTQSQVLRAKQFVLEQYSPAPVAEKFITVYEELIHTQQ